MTRLSFNFFKALNPLLNALQWSGERRHFYEALPHFQEELTLEDLRHVMVNLGYASHVQRLRLAKVSPEVLPCLYIRSQKEIYLITYATEKEVVAYDLKDEGKKVTLPRQGWSRGTVCFFYPEQQRTSAPAGKTWFRIIAHRFRPCVPQLLFQTFFINAFTLIIPLFIWGVYDFVVPSHSQVTLEYLIAGISLAIFCSHAISITRSRLLGYIGARLNMIVGTEVVRHLLFLPVPMVEGVSIGSQIAKIKQFDTVREVFTGPLSQLILEGPFFIFYLLIVGLIGGPIVIIPLLLTLVFVGIGVYLVPLVRRSTINISRVSQDRQAFMVEATGRLSTIKSLNGEKAWLQRFRNFTTRYALAQRDSEKVTTLAANTAQVIMKVAGAAAIIWGAVRVIEGYMSLGALIALIMLIWRTLSPLQALFMVIGRLDIILSSVDQINRLMTLPVERQSSHAQTKKFRGAVAIRNLSFRYPTDIVPALQGVQLDAVPGEVVAVMGDNGSGKSTLVKLLLGFYQPQSGVIAIDGIDIRQYEPRQLRQSISYVPQYCHLFHGTVSQNLRMARPDASDEDILQACEMAGLNPTDLPEGLSTPLTNRFYHEISAGIQQKIMLARAYLTDSRLLILDEPGITLDDKGEKRLKEVITRLRGEVTILLVTHRPSLIQLADRVLALQNGYMRAFGPREKVLSTLA